ncbi:hypothetical protein K439DRAFT_1621412 [Ramaria rubella]|nr:hypothetical protein K439DRAFT_1621412 [Ramaria rubella]
MSLTQGQLADLQEIIPAKFYEDFSGDVLWNNFKSSMSQQRSNGSTRIHREAGTAIFKCLDEDISDSFQCCEKFKELIGWTANANGSGRYKALAPILYKDYQGRHSTTRMYSALARFALSANIQLQPTGASTCIPYQENFEHYLKYLTDGLLKKKALVIAIFHSWNQEFYPHTTPETNNTGEADEESVQEALANLESDDEVERSTGNVSDSGNERHNPGPDAQNQESTEHDPGIQEEDSLSHANERRGHELERESSSSLTDINSNSASQSTGNYQTYRWTSARTAKFNEKNWREGMQTEKRARPSSSTAVQKKRKKNSRV